jgi:hypothetical protein
MTPRVLAAFVLWLLPGCDWSGKQPVRPYDQRCLINCGRASPTAADLAGTWRGPHGAELIIDRKQDFRISVGGKCGFPARDGIAADGYIHGHLDIKQKEGLSTPHDSKVDWYLLIYADDPGISMWSPSYPSYGPRRIELGGDCVLTKVE